MGSEEDAVSCGLVYVEPVLGQPEHYPIAMARR